MNTSEHSKSHRNAFTLIEILMVIAIIGILAAILLPVKSGPIVKPKIRTAQIEMAQIAQSIHRYFLTYGQYPLSNTGRVSVLPPFFPPPGEDFTCGATLQDQSGAPVSIDAAGAYHASNAEVIAILMDEDHYANGSPTPNQHHVRNIQQIKFLQARMVSDVALPGVGPDGVYRDPWGNPYLITFDMNFDDQCQDAFYRLKSVSQLTGSTGHNRLLNVTDASGNGDHFRCRITVMVWSAGPDRKIDTAADAVHGANKDNVLSWAP